MNFSQRYGYAPIPPSLNPEEISDRLRNEFELVLTFAYQKYYDAIPHSRKRLGIADWNQILPYLWVGELEMAAGSFNSAYCIDTIRMALRGSSFHEVFSLIESLCNYLGKDQPAFVDEIQSALKRNSAAYILAQSDEGYGC